MRAVIVAGSSAIRRLRRRWGLMLLPVTWCGLASSRLAQVVRVGFVPSKSFATQDWLGPWFVASPLEDRGLVKPTLPKSGSRMCKWRPPRLEEAVGDLVESLLKRQALVYQPNTWRDMENSADTSGQCRN